jgi:hypothetical protein
MASCLINLAQGQRYLFYTLIEYSEHYGNRDIKLLKIKEKCKGFDVRMHIFLMPTRELPGNVS